MASKRVGLGFPDQRRGRKAILRTPEEYAADEQALESQQPGVPDLQKAGSPAAVPSPIRADGKPDRAAYPKATYRISPAAIDAIDDARRILRRQYGIKATLEEIAEIAILTTCNDLMESQTSSILVDWLSGDTELQDSG